MAVKIGLTARYEASWSHPPVDTGSLSPAYSDGATKLLQFLLLTLLRKSENV